MITQYNIDDLVLLKARIKSIKVTSDGIEYSVTLLDNGARNITYSEDKIYCRIPKEEGEVNSGEDSNKEAGCEEQVQESNSSSQA